MSQHWEQASCAGKEKFDRPTANRVCRETTKTALTSYKCRYCGRHHVGSPKPKNLSRRK